jgi:hypothetical protein
MSRCRFSKASLPFLAHGFIRVADFGRQEKTRNPAEPGDYIVTRSRHDQQIIEKEKFRKLSEIAPNNPTRKSLTAGLTFAGCRSPTPTYPHAERDCEVKRYDKNAPFRSICSSAPERVADAASGHESSFNE